MPDDNAPRVEVIFNYRPPNVTAPPSLSSTQLTTSGTHSFPLTPGTGGTKVYYDSLLGAIRDAKAYMGEELTAWRDAVGDGEKLKEKQAQKARIISEDDEDEDEEIDV